MSAVLGISSSMTEAVGCVPCSAEHEPPNFQHIEEWLADTRDTSSSPESLESAGTMSQIDIDSLCTGAVAAPSNVFEDDILNSTTISHLEALAATATTASGNQTTSKVSHTSHNRSILPAPIFTATLLTTPLTISDPLLHERLNTVDVLAQKINLLFKSGNGNIRLDHAVQSIALIQRVVAWLEALGRLALKDQPSLLRVPGSRVLSRSFEREDENSRRGGGGSGVEVSETTKRVISQSSDLSCVILEKIFMIRNVVRKIEACEYFLR